MLIADVIPLSRGINKDVLSYFTSQAVEIGSIVRVPLRGRTVSAVVTATREVHDLKQEIKVAGFAIKKIDSVVSNNPLPKAFWRAIEKTADYQASSIGSVLYSLVPKTILENFEALGPGDSFSDNKDNYHCLVLQSSNEERLKNYRNLIREEFAKGRSVFICLATVNDVRRVERQIEKGISDYSYAFHGQMKKKDLLAKVKSLREEKHPTLTVATGNFLCLLRSDIGLIIIDQESSRLYKNLTRPFVDIRYFCERLAQEVGAKVVLSDSLIRLETYWRRQNEEIGEVSPLPQRIPLTTEPQIIDMRRDTKDRFKLLSPEIIEVIKDSREKSERAFIFANRRGLAPLTLCSDCGTVVTCKRCSAPVVLHSQAKDRHFLCHHCNAKRDASETCVNCAGWRLKTFGIGSELIYEKIKENFPLHSIFRFDSDTIKTHAQAEKTMREFYASPGGILIGTEMALSYLEQQIENVCVASIDSLLGLPDFRVREKVFSILIKLEEIAQKRFLIQTRNKGDSIFEHIEKGSLTEFYRQELADREKFDYPPFTVLIKISLTGDRETVENSMVELAEKFRDYEFSYYPALVSSGHNRLKMNGLIKIGRTRWVESELLKKLRSLPPSFAISVDPESILV